MITFNLQIRNPWRWRFDSIKHWHGSTPIKFKEWEVSLFRSDDIINLNFELTSAQDHAGMRMALGLFTYCIEFQIYDTRHWDYEEDDYKDDE